MKPLLFKFGGYLDLFMLSSYASSSESEGDDDRLKAMSKSKGPSSELVLPMLDVAPPVSLDSLVPVRSTPL